MYLWALRGSQAVGSESSDLLIEHIPDINSIIAACHERLNDGGLLVLNLPSSDGVFYKLSRLFAAMGKFDFFERLWQKGLPSPHVHYFNRKNLSNLLQQGRSCGYCLAISFTS